MSTTMIKRHRAGYLILLLIITCMATLALFFGSMAFRISGFAPFSLAHAATTCATTRGTQQALCEQQDPVVQGCMKDAHSAEKELVYTPQNTLVGEVDLRYSATCGTSWERTIAYANRPQVRAIDALVTFHTGKREDARAMQGALGAQGQPLTAFTHMLFFKSGAASFGGGVFVLSGMTQPLRIPLQVTVATL